MSKIEKISYEDFEKLEPLDNPYSEGTNLFETYGRELDYVIGTQKIAPLRVWTLLDCEGDTVIMQGLWHINRIAYYVTKYEAPAPEIEVEER